MRLAMTCPAALEHTIIKTPPSDVDPNYYAQLGKITQRVFELYFNQRINQSPKGRQEDTFQRVITKVLDSQETQTRNITYWPGSQTFDTLLKDVRADASQGFRILEKMGLLDKPVRSEQKWNSHFRGIGLFALTDFDYHGKSGVWLFDGKGNKNLTADPGQLLHYALTIASSGRKVAGGGFIYWKHGFRKVDLSLEAVKNWADTKFAAAQPVLKQLKTGASGLPTNPSRENCKFCQWRSACPDSPYHKPGLTFKGEPKEVGFGDAQ